MSELLRTWLITITATTLLVAMMEALLPEGSVKKVCAFALGLFMMISILTPVINIIREPEMYDFTSIFNEMTHEETQYNQVTEKNYKDIIEKLYLDSSFNINDRETGTFPSIIQP